MWELLRRLRFLRFDRRGVDNAGLEMAPLNNQRSSLKPHTRFVKFSAITTEYGFFHPPDQCPPVEFDQYKFWHYPVPNLVEHVAFCQVRFDNSTTQGIPDHIISASYPPLDNATISVVAPAVRDRFPGLRVSFITEDYQGWARVSSEWQTADVATAVATYKIQGGWDESNPIIIVFEQSTLAVRSIFIDEVWQSEVSPYDEEVWFLSDPETRPSLAALAAHLWEDGEFDADGNADTYPNHIRFTIQRRSNHDEMVDIGSLMMTPLVWRISASMRGMARKSAEFLAGTCGGILTEGPVPPGHLA
jgi:hypothetical protein